MFELIAACLFTPCPSMKRFDTYVECTNAMKRANLAEMMKPSPLVKDQTTYSCRSTAYQLHIVGHKSYYLKDKAECEKNGSDLTFMLKLSESKDFQWFCNPAPYWPMSTTTGTTGRLITP